MQGGGGQMPIRAEDYGTDERQESSMQEIQEVDNDDEP
jgi:hypothetical protein